MAPAAGRRGGDLGSQDIRAGARAPGLDEAARQDEAARLDDATYENSGARRGGEDPRGDEGRPGDESRRDETAGPDRPPLQAVPTTAWRVTLASALLAAAVVGWAAVPVSAGRAGTRIALLAAIATAALSVGQLGLSAVRLRDANELGGLLERFTDLLRSLRAAPLTEVMIVAVLALEALHPARPWHTAVLAVALLAYLFAVHLAETRARLTVLRPQLPVLAAGIGLLALAVGVAALPGLPHGTPAALIRAAAITAAVIVAAMALPATAGRRR
jgi:hypothetical protein